MFLYVYLQQYVGEVVTMEENVWLPTSAPVQQVTAERDVSDQHAGLGVNMVESVWLRDSVSVLRDTTETRVSIVSLHSTLFINL